MSSPTVYDHLRPTDSDHPAGTYRVVGTRDAAVTLLRVADGDGRREHTGKIVTVGREELDGFAPAENPEGARPAGAAVASTVETLYWSLRVFVRQLAGHPLPSAVAIVLLLAGSFGDDVASLPDGVPFGLTVLGALALAYVGSGRLDRR